MDALDEAVKADEAWRMARRELTWLLSKRNHAVRAARDRGFKAGKIAEALGVSPGRITQMVKSAEAQR